MDYMLCRNRVKDFATWKRVFDSHSQDHRAAGMTLRQLWRAKDDPNMVFFLFELADLKKAKAFIDAPAGADAGKASGVIDGEYHFVVSA